MFKSLYKIVNQFHNYYVKWKRKKHHLKRFQTEVQYLVEAAEKLPDDYNDYFPAELYQFKKISEITDSTKIKLSKNLFII